MRSFTLLILISTFSLAFFFFFNTYRWLKFEANILTHGVFMDLTSSTYPLGSLSLPWLGSCYDAYCCPVAHLLGFASLHVLVLTCMSLYFFWWGWDGACTIVDKCAFLVVSSHESYVYCDCGLYIISYIFCLNGFLFLLFGVII